MKNKKLTVLALTAGLSVLSCIPAFASGWQKDTVGWWYGTNENNTTWYNSGWQWVDGNNDGIAESYYFNSNGYISVNSVIDNYWVNADGACTYDGVVLTKEVKLSGEWVDASGNRRTKDGHLISGGSTGNITIFEVEVPSQTENQASNNTSSDDYWSDWNTGMYDGEMEVNKDVDAGGYTKWN